MKTRELYIFYGDEDVASKLRDKLGINPERDDISKLHIGSYESGVTFEEQLKEVKWSEVGIGRYTVLYYSEVYQIDNDDGTTSQSVNINHAHIIVRHTTKEDLRKEDPKKVIEALTILDEADTI